MNQEIIGKIKYYGPEVENKTMDAEKLGKTILSYNSMFKKYSLRKKEWIDLKPRLKIKIDYGSYEIIGYIIACAILADKLGITELSKSFFSEIGKQLSMKLFAKKEPIKKEGQPIIENGKMYIIFLNNVGDKQKFDAETYELYKEKIFDKEIEQITEPLEPQKIDKIKYTFSKDQKDEYVEIKEDEKLFLRSSEEEIDQADLEEEFDDSIAEETPLLYGKLVTYHALTKKYPFQFQPREYQEIYGKNFVPCMLADESIRDECIELMKTQHKENLIIQGRGIKNESGHYKKIKIKMISEINPTLL